MKQVSPFTKDKAKRKRGVKSCRGVVVGNPQKRKHPEYGTSKLEDKFAREFLDKLGLDYIKQFEAKDIKRFYDFFVKDYNFIIEVDGDYYHSYGKVYEEMSPMQKKNKRVDELKDKWALMHGIPILRVWEHDIHDNPKKVFEELEKLVGKQHKLNEMKKRMNRPH